MGKIQIYQIKIPEYQVKTKPDWAAIGEKIDKILIKHFLGKKVAIRCLSSKEHKGKSINGLVKAIKKIGTDRYNPRRKGDRYFNIGNKHIDFFALERTVKTHSRIMWQFIWSFYEFPKRFKGKRVRVDISIIYDRSKLKKVLHVYPDGRRKSDGYIFRNPNEKNKSVIGIIKIL